MSRLVIRFERLDDGTLVALRTRLGRSVAAIVHPPLIDNGWDGPRRWTIAGDLMDRSARPHGESKGAAGACSAAAGALGSELGITVDAYEYEL